MKLFENGVGRPSNETIKKRRNFYISIVVLVVAVLGVSSYFLARTFSNAEILGTDKNAKPSKKLEIISYPRGSVTLPNGYISSSMASYIISFTHNYKSQGKPQKLYYRVTTYKRKSLNQVDPEVKTGSCKSIKGVKDLSLSTSHSTKEIYATITLYSDKKCATKALDSVTTKHYLYDNVKPSISKACQRNGYVEVTAKDDYQIKNIAWTITGTSCKKITSSAKTNINSKSISSKKINQKLTTTQKVKVCVWDLVGNLEEKWVDKTC